MAPKGATQVLSGRFFGFILLASLYAVSAQNLTGCGEHFNTSSGSFASPGYPTNLTSTSAQECTQTAWRRCWPSDGYYCYTDCVWTITIPDAQQKIELSITDMEFTQKDCCQNFLEVRDGLGRWDHALAGPCGTGSFPGIVSSGNSLLIALRSSNETFGHRFRASWKTACSVTVTSESGLLQSPGYPSQYPSDEDCIYVIEQQEGFLIQLQFSHFNLDAQSNGNCSDYLEIHDGYTVRHPLLGGGRFCGNNSPGRLISTSHNVVIKFHSDSASTASSTGFQVIYNRTTPECFTSLQLPASGVITSPGFPNKFQRSGNCSWEIQIPKRNVVEFTFHTVELGPDGDEILDCDSPFVKSVVSLYEVMPNDNENLLARYCRRNVIPHVITTKLRAVTLRIEFESKNVNNYYFDYYDPFFFYDYYNPNSEIHGFNASYKTSPKSFVDSEQPLLAYGPYPEDNKMSPDDLFTSIKLNTSVQVGDNQFQYILIFKNGKIVFSSSSYASVQTLEPACMNRYYETLCPYCSYINSSSHERAAVYYRLQTANSKTWEKVSEDVNTIVKKFKGTDTFRASSVLVVTWEQVQHAKSSSQVHEGFATFQAAIAVSETETYGLVLYKVDFMNWEVPGKSPGIDVGFTIHEHFEPQCRDLPHSRTKKVLDIDYIPGNIGIDGAWVFKLGEFPPSAEQACDDWYKRNDGKISVTRATDFKTLPECPCVAADGHSIDNYGIWIYDEGVYSQTEYLWIYCYRLTRAASQTLWPYGKKCCYREEYINSSYTFTLIQDKPYAGSATAFSPAFPDTYADYLREDKQAYKACCLDSNSTKSCDKFYELRPTGECDPDAIIVRAIGCCDPYITTLDEGGYSFNGWGEYTMVTASSPVAFTLQARTDLAETEIGKLSNATVFTAFGVEEDGVRVFVGLEPSTKNSLIIYANNEDFSKRFQDDNNLLVDNDDFFLQRKNDSALISFLSGVSIQISIRIKSLTISVSLPKSFRHNTRGLMGNFNGIKTDDFILPNGTSIGPNPTERQIYEIFGPSWAVTAANSVMRYAQREGPKNFSHPEFTPVFLDEQSDDVKNRAKAVCGDNLACQYDYVATGSESFALDSKLVKEDAERLNAALKNRVPQIQVPSVLYLTVGKQHTFTLTGNDVDGDSFTYHIENDENGMVQVNSTTGEVTYTPQTNSQVNMRFYTMDSHNAKSPPRSVEVFVCSGCGGHGVCDYTSVVTLAGEQQSYSFHTVECVCNPGWEGDECETPRDDCANNPCMEGQTCRNLTPQEQGNGVIGFDCGPCPAGFTRWTGDIECHDVDECDDNVRNVCQMTCINTFGSFECECRAGYRLQSDGSSCVDINECQEKTSNCQQVCNNTAEGYTCGCEAGYTLDENGYTCQQNEEMRIACQYSDCSQGCKPGVDPVTGQPAIQCFCYSGFDNTTEDGSECRNHDECQDSDNLCNQRCYDFDGGFSCSCYDGYHLAADRATCLPCSDLTYGPFCQYTCRCSGHGVDCHNVKGCICEQGWRGTQCQDDIDECTETPNVCGTTKVCLNTPGSYLCQCPDGYVDDESGSCTDLDECAEDSLLNTCDSPKRCVNVPGSFHCACISGYTLSNGQCIDIDECGLSISDCEQNCTNVPGSYNCDCVYGYRLNSDRATCSKVSTVCGGSLSCEHGCTLRDDNTEACFCKLGHTLNADQQSCDMKQCSSFGCSHTCSISTSGPVCTCPDGMLLNNNLKTCQACPTGTYGKDCAQACACGLGASSCNSVTGCFCQPGWTGSKCDQDSNECNTVPVQQACQSQQAVCLNTPGSYRCDCQSGYQKNSNDICQDIDECDDDPCSQQCQNTPGSYRCVCSEGFQLDVTTNICEDVDECNPGGSIRCTQSCINTHGSYLCTCNMGYTLARDGVSCVAKDLGSAKMIMTVGITPQVSATELSDNTSLIFLAWSRDVSQQLQNKLQLLGYGVTEFVVTSLRHEGGNLVISCDIKIDEAGYPDIVGKLAEGLSSMRSQQLTVQGQTGDIVHMELNGNPIEEDGSPCDAHEAIRPCPADRPCRVENEVPVCRTPISEDSHDNTLAIALGVVFSLAVLAAVIFAIMWIKHKKGASVGSTVWTNPAEVTVSKPGGERENSVVTASNVQI